MPSVQLGKCCLYAFIRIVGDGSAQVMDLYVPPVVLQVLGN